MKTFKAGQYLFFSDLHIKNNSDEVYRTLIALLHQELKNDSIMALFFLGDIFDLLVGPFSFWHEEYSEFFKILSEFNKKNVEIIWIEGNHDFYIDELLAKADVAVKVQDPDYVMNVETKSGLRKIYLSHGDLVNSQDKAYFRWRFLTRSFVFRAILKAFGDRGAKAILKPWGEKLSQNSRKTNASYNAHNSELKQLYRGNAEALWKSGFDGVFMGHCHIPDEYQNSSLKKFYFNAGSRFDLKDTHALRYGFWDTQSSDFPNTKLYSTM